MRRDTDGRIVCPSYIINGAEKQVRVGMRRRIWSDRGNPGPRMMMRHQSKIRDLKMEKIMGGESSQSKCTSFGLDEMENDNIVYTVWPITWP